MSSWHDLIFILTFAMSFTGEFCQLVEDFSGDTSMFVTEGECAVDTFAVELYRNYPNIPEPHGSKGSFLKIDKSGCMITRPLALETGSQFILIYLTVVPEIELQIIIGDQVFKPDTKFTSWGSFIKKIDRVTSNQQVKITAHALRGKPLLIIDNFRIIPPLWQFMTQTPFRKHEPTPTQKTVKKSANLKPASKPSLVDIFSDTTEKNSQAISTGMSKESTSREISTGIFKESTSREISTGISEESTSREISTGISEESTSREISTGISEESTSRKITTGTSRRQNPESAVVFRQRKVEESDRKIKKVEGKSFRGDKKDVRNKPAYLTRADEQRTTPKHFDDVFIDNRSGTTVEFWTYLAIVSLLLTLLLLILTIFVNTYLVRENCV